MDIQFKGKMINLMAITTDAYSTPDKEFILIDDSVMEEFKQFMGDDAEDMVKELLELYLKNTPNAITTIGDDIRANDINALKNHVHGLKGSSAQLGIVGISSLCRNIEVAIQEEKIDEVLPLFEQILSAYKQIEKIITKRLKVD